MYTQYSLYKINIKTHPFHYSRQLFEKRLFSKGSCCLFSDRRQTIFQFSANAVSSIHIFFLIPHPLIPFPFHFRCHFSFMLLQNITVIYAQVKTSPSRRFKRIKVFDVENIIICSHMHTHYKIFPLLLRFHSVITEYRAMNDGFIIPKSLSTVGFILIFCYFNMYTNRYIMEYSACTSEAGTLNTEMTIYEQRHSVCLILEIKI